MANHPPTPPPTDLDKSQGWRSEYFIYSLQRNAYNLTTSGRPSRFFPSLQTNTSEGLNDSQGLVDSREVEADGSCELLDFDQNVLKDLLDTEMDDSNELDGPQEHDDAEPTHAEVVGLDGLQEHDDAGPTYAGEVGLDGLQEHDDTGPTYAKVVGLKPALPPRTQQNDPPKTANRPSKRPLYPKKSPSPSPPPQNPTPPSSEWKTVGGESGARPSTRQARPPKSAQTRGSVFNRFAALSRNQRAPDSEGLKNTRKARAIAETEVGGNDATRTDSTVTSSTSAAPAPPVQTAQPATAQHQPPNQILDTYRYAAERVRNLVPGTPG